MSQHLTVGMEQGVIQRPLCPHGRTIFVNKISQRNVKTVRGRGHERQFSIHAGTLGDAVIGGSQIGVVVGVSEQLCAGFPSAFLAKVYSDVVN
jgi:hypothetical protein